MDQPRNEPLLSEQLLVWLLAMGLRVSQGRRDRPVVVRWDERGPIAADYIHRRIGRSTCR